LLRSQSKTHTRRLPSNYRSAIVPKPLPLPRGSSDYKTDWLLESPRLASIAKVKSLDVPDIHHIRAAQGWLELGNHLEANAELENIAPEFRAHPDVLDLRWHIYAKDAKWDACGEIAAALLKLAPDCHSGWLHLAYSARRATGGGLQTAYDVLRPAAAKFPHVPTIPYNLACYTCQLGRLKEAWDWLEKAFDISPNPAPLKTMALDDPDLEPLWLDIAEI